MDSEAPSSLVEGSLQNNTCELNDVEAEIQGDAENGQETGNVHHVDFICYSKL